MFPWQTYDDDYTGAYGKPDEPTDDDTNEPEED